MADVDDGGNVGRGGGGGGAMEPESQKLQQDDDDDEFLDGSHQNSSLAAGQPLSDRDRVGHHQNHNNLQHQNHPARLDASRADDAVLSGGPTATALADAPAGAGNPAAAATAATATAAISKEMLQVEVELRLLEALEIYHPAKLQGIHRHFILYGLMEYLERRLNHHFSSEEILELLDRFYNLDLLKPDEDESELLSQEEDFSLPASILSVKEELRELS